MLRITLNPLKLNLVTIVFTYAFLKVAISPRLPPGLGTQIQLVLCGLPLLWLMFRSFGSVINASIIPLVLLAGYMTLSLSWSLDPVYGAVKLQAWIIGGVLPAVTIYALLTRTTQRINWGVFVLVAAIFAAATLVFGSGQRNSLDGLNVIWTSRIALAALTVTLFTRMPLPVKVALVGLFATVAFRSESRGPVIALAVPLGIYLAYRAIQLVLKLRFRVSERAVGMVMFALVPLLLVGYTAYSYIGRLQETRYVTLGSDDDGSVSIRSELISTAVEMFQRNPVGGNGVGGFSWYFQNYYPHNFVVEFASEGGTIALLLVLWLLARAIRSAWFLRQPGPTILAVQCLGYALFSGALDGNPEWFILYGVLTGMAISEARAVAAREAPALDMELEPTVTS